MQQKEVPSGLMGETNPHHPMRYLFFLSLIVLFFSACREDAEFFTMETTVPDPSVRKDSAATISGKILNERGNPITNAEIIFLGVGVSRVDEENFQIIITDPGAGGTFLVRKEGYFDAWREFIPEASSFYRTNVVLRSSLPQATIDAQTGGNYSLPSGASITIRPGSVLNNGVPYTGNVNVALSFMDPANDRSLLQSPGNLLSSDESVLASFGMMDVALTSDSGTPLTLSQQSPAELFFPLSRELSSSEVDSIVFWDLVESRWNSSGATSRQDRAISAFIFGGGTFNCDVPSPRAIVCARIVSPDGTPLAYQSFSLSFSFGGPRVFTFTTDHLGRLCANIPLGVPIDLIVFSECPGEEEARVRLGTFQEYGPNEFGDVVVDYLPRGIAVSATFCPGNRPFTEADGYVWMNGYRYNGAAPFLTDESGNGQIHLPSCTEEETLSIQAVANDGRRTSRLISRSNQDLSDLSLSICSDPEQGEYYTADLEGAQHNMNAVSYLRTGSPTVPERHQFWGEANSPTDSVEVFVFLNQLNTGPYDSEAAEVVVFNYQPGSAFTYPCIEGCDDMVVNVTATGPNDSWIEGTYSYTARKVNLSTREVVVENLPITGTFHLNR